MSSYDHKQIESKWIPIWKKSEIYATPKTVGEKGKKFVLDMWPYPSGAGLHVGHVEGYTGTDIVSRYYRMNGYSVLHPMGWDAFGLPAENYAIKTGIHPSELTEKSIATFKRQMDMTGLSYDWEREISSSDQEYYRWTQWLFILLYKRGLAYKKESPVNWCPSCETVLANEQVVEGKCERCDSQVEKKSLNQWFFKITDYADRLLEGLDRIDWPNSTKAIQRNWIGRSEGHNIEFPISIRQPADQLSTVHSQLSIPVFTTRPDTLHGATFLALAVDHPCLPSILTPEKSLEIAEIAKSWLGDVGERNRDKQGIFIGVFATNPATGSQLPVWVTNYVSSDYGTGAIMGVPAHDERDREFATKYQIDIVEMEPDESMVKFGKPAVSYHLRDWLISRQRYWGPPIPMIYCEQCARQPGGQGWNPVPEADLPIKLPLDVDFRPTGESPIARSQEFQRGVVCPVCSGPARREVDTIDTFGDSSWYFLRFADPHNEMQIFDPAKVSVWNPVDLYVGGEHATTHLIFSRFIVKVLFDEGLLSFDEPFSKLRMVGMITDEDGRKMSKRWGNVINPDDMVEKFGADSMRMYEMFMGPFSDGKAWSTSGIEGVSRFLNRFYRLFDKTHGWTSPTLGEVNRLVDKLVQKVTSDIETMSFNTSVAAMMSTLNRMHELTSQGDKAGDWARAWERYLLVMAPFAPFLAEELYQVLRAEKSYVSIHTQEWPQVDGELAADEDATIVVQVNGVVRDRLQVPSDYSTSQDQVEQLALASAKVQGHINGANYRVIFVPGKIINFVVS